MSQSESRRVAHCMYVEIELKKKKEKKKEILILKVWFYGNSVKLWQSPTHECVITVFVHHRDGVLCVITQSVPLVSVSSASVSLQNHSHHTTSVNVVSVSSE